MNVLDEIYMDVVTTLAISGGDSNHSLCANELRAIRNKLQPMVSRSVIIEAARREKTFAGSLNKRNFAVRNGGIQGTFPTCETVQR